MKDFILTVCPAGTSDRPQFTLQLAKEIKHLSSSCTKLIITLENKPIEIEDGIDTYKKYQRLTNSEINQWILKNKLDNYKKGNPIKLIFSLKISKNTHNYILYPFQANLLKNDKL